MENNLIYTTRSRQDLDDIWDYISFDLQNLPSAERILNRIMDAAEQLKLFPESGALLSSVAPLDHELYLDERFLVSGKYLIFIMLFGTIFILTASSTAGGIICGFCSGTLCRKNKLFCRASRNVFDRFISGTAGNLHFSAVPLVFSAPRVIICLRFPLFRKNLHFRCCPPKQCAMLRKTASPRKR